MSDPIWNLGPAGDMRPLVCPERDMDISVERYGGIFQGLSGARSMTVTGQKQRFNFELRYLSIQEYAWLEALHFRSIFGVYRLRNPFKRNLLSPNGSLVRSVSDNRTIKVTSGIAGVARGHWPSAAGNLSNISAKWTNRSVGTQVIRIDDRYRVPVVPGSPVTFSMYLKASSAISAASTGMVIDWWDIDSASLGASPAVFPAVATTWDRFSVTATPPANAVFGRGAFYTNVTAPDIYAAAAQFEEGSTPTAWEIGGGAPVVLLDKLETSSPRFPYRTTILSLLEA